MKKLVIAGCALAITTMAAAAEAAVLVVRSSGPSARAFPAGKAIPEAQTLNLKANDIVVLLDSRGTRTLRGPGNFSAAASASNSTSALAALTSQNANRRSRVGAVRGVPTGATAGRNVWQADLGRSGNLCFANPADLGIYRAAGGGAETVTVTDSASGKTAKVQFNAGQTIANWPTDMPVAAGNRYQIVGGASNVSYTAHLIQPVPAGLEGLAQSFIRNDCNAQLDVLIDTFAGPSAS
jgi:hypothetical protein